jgi:hypothetical protein
MPPGPDISAIPSITRSPHGWQPLHGISGSCAGRNLLRKKLHCRSAFDAALRKYYAQQRVCAFVFTRM